MRANKFALTLACGLLACAINLSSCDFGQPGGARDGGADDSGLPTYDANCPDALSDGSTPDGGSAADATVADATTPDAMTNPDAMAPDAMAPDATAPDAMAPDAMGNPDAMPMPDAPPPDDCDPDPPIFPGALEIIDGLDNDCDGLVDELEVCATGAPYPTIGAAIAAAPDQGVIQICPGTYPERLTIGKSLRLVGSAQASATVIDAGQLGTAVSISAVAAPGVILEGLTLQHGKTAGRGGGLRCLTSQLRLENVRLVGNEALEGGGLYASGCHIWLAAVAFEGNSATQRGGAASISGGGGTLEDSTISTNSSGREGGGLAVYQSDLSVCRNTFTGNTAGLQGGALHYRGNAIIEDNRFENNTSGWTGGGIYLNQCSPTLRNNELIENTSVNDGGGAYFDQGSALFENNHVKGNHSGDDGGGLRFFESSATVRHNLIEANVADGDGGGIRVSHMPCLFEDNSIVDNSAVGSGGGMDMDNDASTVRGGEVSRNHGGAGGGIHAWLFPWTGGTIENVLFEGNVGWHGGDMHITHNFQSITLRGLTFKDNVAGYGAGIYLRTSKFKLSNSVFHGNWASHDGAAIMIGREGYPYGEAPCPPCPPSFASGTIDFVVAHDNEADERGSAIWIRSPDLTVRSSIFTANVSSAVFVDLEYTNDPNPPAPGAPPPEPPPKRPIWRFNNTFPTSFVGIADPTGSDGNMSADPAFTDSSNGNFHLSPGSICIDAGDPAFKDIDSTRADMGAFGGQGVTP